MNQSQRIYFTLGALMFCSLLFALSPSRQVVVEVSNVVAKPQTGQTLRQPPTLATADDTTQTNHGDSTPTSELRSNPKSTHGTKRKEEHYKTWRNETYCPFCHAITWDATQGNIKGTRQILPPSRSFDACGRDRFVVGFCMNDNQANVFSAYVGHWVANRICPAAETEILPVQSTEEAFNVDVLFCDRGATDLIKAKVASNPESNVVSEQSENPGWQRVQCATGTCGYVFWPKSVKRVKPLVKPFMARTNYEPWSTHISGLDLLMDMKREHTSFTYATNQFATLHMPLFTSLGDAPDYLLAQGLDALVVDHSTFDPHKIMAQKEHFAIFSQKNCWGNGNTEMAPLRLLFVQQLSKTYKATHNLGYCLNNINNLPPSVQDVARSYKASRGSRNWFQRSLEENAKYKFVVSFENNNFNGGGSEKLSAAVLANSVPIYWGSRLEFSDGPDSEMEKRYNHKRFVLCGKPERWKGDELKEVVKVLKMMKGWSGPYGEFLSAAEEEAWDTIKGRTPIWDEFEECIDRIRYLDSNDTAYMEVLAEPFFIGNDYRGKEGLDPMKVGQQFQSVMEALGYFDG